MKNLIFIEAITCAALACFYFVLTNKSRVQLGLGPILIATALPAAGFILPSPWLVYGACVAAIPLCARSRRDIAPLYVFSLFVMPDLGMVEAFGPLKLASVKTSTCLGIGALIAVVWRGGLDVRPSKLDIPFGVILALMVFIGARDTSATNFLRASTDVLLQYWIPYLIVSRLVSTPSDFRRLAVAFACGGSLLACFLLIEFALHWPFHRAMYETLGLDLGSPLSVKFREGSLRATGPFIEATAAGFCLTFAIFAASQIRVAFATKLFHLGVLGLLTLGAFAPQSRGALLGIAVGAGAIYLYRRSQTVIAMLLVGAGVLAVFFATIGLQPDTEAAVATHSSETIEYRGQLMRRGLEEFSETPITGDSYPNIIERMEDLRQGEGIVDFVNTYLWIALVSGIIGLILFVIAFAAPISQLWRNRPRLKRAGFPSGAGAFAFSALCAAMAMLAFTSLGGRIAIITFIGMALSAGLGVASARRPRGGGVMVTGAAPQGLSPQPRGLGRPRESGAGAMTTRTGLTPARPPFGNPNDAG